MEATAPPPGTDAPGTAASGVHTPEPARLPLWLRIALCCVIPLIYVVPGMLPGQRFLPMAPVAFAPLSLEYPEAAEAARVGQSFATVDRLFPTLTDQLEIRERVWAGESLLWEPDQGLGLSLIGNTISGPFYPPNWLAVLLPPDRAAPFLAWFVLTWVALGLWALLAQLGNPERACLVAALAAQAAGFGVANLHYGMKVDAVAWLPWSLWAIEGVRRGKRGSAPLLALFSGLPFLAGFPPIAVFASGAAGLYALLRMPKGLMVMFGPLVVALGLIVLTDGLAGKYSDQSTDATRSLTFWLLAIAGLWFLVQSLLGLLPKTSDESPSWTRRRLTSALVLPLMIGPLLGAIQLLPTLEASSVSHRVPKNPEQLELEALSLRTWIGVPLADVYGLPTDPPAPLGSALAWATEDPADNGRTQQAVPLEWNAYAGAAVFLLALLGLSTGRRALFPALLILVSFGFAQAWPGFRLLYHVPGLDGGAPARALSVAWIAWAWLAGLGACALAGPRRSVRSVGIALGLVGLGAGLWLALREVDLTDLAAGLAARYDVGLAEVERYVPAEQGRALVANLARAGRALALGSGLVLLASLASARPERARIGTALLVLALGLEALLFSRVHVLSRDLGGLPLFPESEAIEAVREAAGAGRVLRLDQSADGISEVIELARPNLLHAYDIADLTPYVAFTPAGLVRTMEAIEPQSRFRSGVSGLHDPANLDHPWLDAAGVSCILSLNPVSAPGLELVHAQPRFHVYRRTTAITGARLVARVQQGWSTPSAQTLMSMEARRSTSVDWPNFSSTRLGADPLPQPEQSISQPWRAPLELPIEWVSGHRARVEVPPGESEAMLVLPAGYRLPTTSSGWAASGAVTAAGTLLADSSLTAARVVAEGGTVEFTYRSGDARLGRWLSGGALLLIFLSGLVAWRRR